MDYDSLVYRAQEGENTDSEYIQVILIPLILIKTIY